MTDIIAPAQEVRVPLEQFCAVRSAKDRRVEMLGAFFASEKAAGHVMDTAENFAARLDAFSNQPA